MEKIPHITCDNLDTSQRIKDGLRYYLGEKAQWNPDYDGVAQWFADNQRRGLICIGPCGVGKSLICRDILPQLYRTHFRDQLEVFAVSATDMNRRIDDLLKFCDKRHIIVIDDLGTEAVETVNYGNRRRPFCELVDKAEQTGTLLIITTNLLTSILRLKEDCPLGRKGDPNPSRQFPSIEERYGVRTLDRLRAITKVVVFRGESMRK